MRRVGPAAVALAVLLVACTGDDDDGGLPPTSSTDPSATTTTVDFSAISLPPVGGATTSTTVPLVGGEASMGGTVAGPAGAAAGAVVRIERFVGDQVASADVPVAADGTWRIDEIFGGRYRVRAWRVPDLAMTDAQILFLQGTERRTLNLRVEEVGGFGVKTAIAPDPPVADRPAELRVLLTFTEVDATGVVRGQPQVGVPVTLTGSGSWTVDTSNPARTDGAGVARWVLRCLDEGDQPLGVVFDTAQGSMQLPLELPPCDPAPRPPPTTQPRSTTTSQRPATTTSSSSTTTTTEP